MDIANDETMVNTEPIKKSGSRFTNEVAKERKYPDISVTSSCAAEENRLKNSSIEIAEEGENLCRINNMRSLICFE